MKEQILELLKKEAKAFSIEELEDVFHVKTAQELTDLMKTLNELEETLQIYRTKKDHYMLFQNSHLKIGKFIGHKKGFGFVDIEGTEDVYIASSNTNGAIDGDQVIVEITSKNKLDLEGRIVRITKRDLKDMVGEYQVQDGIGYIDLDDEKVKIRIEIDQNLSHGAVPGHKVLVKVLNKLKGNTYKGEVLRILGHKDDPGVDILSIMLKMGIHDEFDEKVEEQLKNIPSEVKKEELEGRTDLRKEVIFTIDGDDTKDIDDAISIEQLPNGNYKLGVHIADVSHYVKEGSPLDLEAFERGTSNYLANSVVPMLPHELSNGICSLNPNVDRLAQSCVMEINEKGTIVDYDIFRSVIRSNIQMTYKKVNMILEKNTIPEGYEPFVNHLHLLKNVSDILRKMKTERGNIDFDLDEAKIVVDEDGKCIDVVLRNRGTGEKIIEDCMIVANETVATHIYNMGLPFVYRVHGTPNEEKIADFLRFVSVLGYKVTGKASNIHPKAIQQILDQLKGKKEFPMLSSILLRSMQKAVYDSNNIGHFGIASKCYTHFTSPIRRYPDLMVHRFLDLYLFEHQMDSETIDYWERKLPIMTEHCSERERNAIECEREVDSMKMAEYMEDHIGEHFKGMIVGATTFGLFVQLPNLIEGLVRYENLDGDFYTYDDSTFTAYGKKNKKGYRLGDEIEVIVIDANKESHTIDFALDRKENEELINQKG